MKTNNPFYTPALDSLTRRLVAVGILEESKADEVRKLALKGGMSKAAIAKATGANYSQVHSIIKAMGDVAKVDAGVRGRAAGSSPTKKKVATKKPTATKKSVTKKAPTKKSTTTKKAPKAPVVRPVSSGGEALSRSMEQGIHSILGSVDIPLDKQEVIADVISSMPIELRDNVPASKLHQMVDAHITFLATNYGEIKEYPDGTIAMVRGNDADYDEPDWNQIAKADASGWTDSKFGDDDFEDDGFPSVDDDDYFESRRPSKRNVFSEEYGQGYQMLVNSYDELLTAISIGQIDSLTLSDAVQYVTGKPANTHGFVAAGEQLVCIATCISQQREIYDALQEVVQYDRSKRGLIANNFYELMQLVVDGSISAVNLEKMADYVATEDALENGGDAPQAAALALLLVQAGVNDRQIGEVVEDAIESRDREQEDGIDGPQDYDGDDDLSVLDLDNI